MIHKASKGYTLLELLIVIAIIGILISVGVASYGVAQKKSRDSKRMSDMKAYQSALEQYYAANTSKYPVTCMPTTDYMPGGLPADPKNTAPYVYSPSNCSETTYCICATLEGTTGNSGPACDFANATKTYYCVMQLQ